MRVELPDHVADALKIAAAENGCAPEDAAVAMLEELLHSMGYIQHTCQKEGDHEEEKESDGRVH